MSDNLAEIMANPALLKLELMAKGLRIPMERRAGIGGEPYGVSGHALFGSAGDLDLVLPGGTWASVPVMRGLMRSTPYKLSHGRNGLTGWHIHALGLPEERVPVQVQKPPHFFQHTTSQGIPYGRIGTVHGPYMALSPTNNCSFLASPDACRFCGVGQGGNTHDPVPVDDIIEAIRIARAEHPIAMVYLSVGHLATNDGGVGFLEPYVKAIKKHFDILVAVDSLPPDGDEWIDQTYGMGVDSVSYNLEIWNPSRFELICPGPSKAVGRERFLEALAYAATVFPSGATTCHLIVGLEPCDSTHEGIEVLTSMGVLPLLPMYRPFKGRDMRRDSDIELFPPSHEQLVALHTHLYRAVRDARINLNLVRDIAIVTTPLEGRFFAADDSFWTSLHQRMMGTPIGRRTSAYLSDLRRALRVRATDDPG